MWWALNRPLTQKIRTICQRTFSGCGRKWANHSSQHDKQIKDSVWRCNNKINSNARSSLRRPQLSAERSWIFSHKGVFEKGKINGFQGSCHHTELSFYLWSIWIQVLPKIQYQTRRKVSLKLHGAGVVIKLLAWEGSGRNYSFICFYNYWRANGDIWQAVSFQGKVHN